MARSDIDSALDDVFAEPAPKRPKFKLPPVGQPKDEKPAAAKPQMQVMNVVAPAPKLSLDEALAAVDGARAAGARQGKIGTLASAWDGLKSGVALNFDDEISGIGEALTEKLFGDATVDPSLRPTFGEAYRRGRDAQREFSRDAYAAHPAANIGGSVVGGIATALVPAGLVAGGAAKTGALAAKVLAPVAARTSAVGAPLLTRIGNALVAPVANGAIYGTVQGTGAANELEDIPADALKGAAIGGLFGVGGAALGAVGRKIVAPIAARRTREAAQKADALRVMTASGDTGGSIGNVPIMKEVKTVPAGPGNAGGAAEAARVMRATGMAPALSTTQDILNRATTQNDRANNIISKILDGVDEAYPEVIGKRAGLDASLAALGGEAMGAPLYGTQKSMATFATKPVDIKGWSNRLSAEADALSRQPEMRFAAEAMRGRADEYAKLFPNGASMREAQTLKTQLADLTNYVGAANGQRLPNAQIASKTGARLMTEAMENAEVGAFAGKGLPAAIADEAEVVRRQVFPAKGSPTPGQLALPPGQLALPPPPGGGTDAGSVLDAYRAARRLSQVSGIVKDAAEISVDRGSKKAAVGLMDRMLAAPGEALGNALGGKLGAAVGSVAAPWLSAAIKPYGATAKASSAEAAIWAVGVLDKAPGAIRAIGRGTGQALMDAARIGPQALYLRHQAELKSNPAYAAFVEQGRAR